MARVFDCSTEEDAYALVGHHLSNDLAAISILSVPTRNESETEQGQREDKLGRKRMELVGAFCILAERMQEQGYSDAADWIRGILRILLTQDVTDADVRDAIHTKYKEVGGIQGEFEERGRLIEQMLDKIYPIPSNASQEVREGIDSERQMLSMRAGWGGMPINELRRIASL